MMLCKQEARGMPLSVEHDEWLHDTDEEPDEQELEVHYMYMANIQEFRNDQFASILGYGDLVQGNVSIKGETSSPTPICFMAKASPTQAWLCHRRLSHLNFDTINLLSKNDIMNGLLELKFVKDQLCSSWEMGKANRSSFKTKTVPSFKRRLHSLHMDLCGLMRVESINGKKYILVIVDDYSRYTWTQVITVRTDRETEFLNKILQTYFKEEGIVHQTTIAQTPEQNDVVERQNRTLVKATRTMLPASKLPLIFWAEAIATACYTQNITLIIPRHKKTPYHIINERKPTL
ncbi:retrovirus-related pol polyprotein from transposon TNT 1-94 [Tanacetum coccineum]